MLSRASTCFFKNLERRASLIKEELSLFVPKELKLILDYFHEHLHMPHTTHKYP
ncbi:Hypothetical predicted protein [Olea europaea subsp. europaea]|uniref:Uncharacterized protein n=1 Tax=Olea europaea subsp. europaea TaxID=158383 RepID=A0A8S0TH58_OLEEU|nr:Hypothetical predicted protein [Olea europaea subsp. europaea]